MTSALAGNPCTTLDCVPKCGSLVHMSSAVKSHGTHLEQRPKPLLCDDLLRAMEDGLVLPLIRDC